MTNHIGEHILLQENSPSNIKKLEAQREVYARAKHKVLLYLIFAVIGVFLSLMNKLVLKFFWIDIVLTIYSLVLFLINSLYLERKVKKLREKAASVQEAFDCEVLDISPNRVLFATKHQDVDIPKYSDLRKQRMKKKSSKKQDDLINWYATSINRISNNTAKLICQRTNIVYDTAVRKSFLERIAIALLAISTITCILTLAVNLSLQTFAVSVVLPLLPIFTISIKWHYEQKDSIQNLTEIEKFVERLWDEIIEGKISPNDIPLRQIQDRIHLHRKTCPLVPDIIYNSLRKKTEQQVWYSIEEQVNQYIKSQASNNHP